MTTEELIELYRRSGSLDATPDEQVDYALTLEILVPSMLALAKAAEDHVIRNPGVIDKGIAMAYLPYRAALAQLEKP